MHLCFSTLGCPAWTLGQIIEAAVANGIEGIDFRGLGPEIDITKLPAFGAELDATLSQLRQRGLSMPCLNTSVALVSPSPERWQAMLDECHRYATLARRTDTRFVRIFGGGVPAGMSRDEALMMARRHLRQVVKVCRPLGVRPLVETHDDWVTSDQLLELLRELTVDEAGVLWDIEHTHWRKESPQDVFGRMGRWIRHVHVKDAVRAGGKIQTRLLGEGELPIAESMRVLCDGGYDGWICFEGEKRWDADAAEPEVSVPQFAEYMRGVFATIES